MNRPPALLARGLRAPGLPPAIDARAPSLDFTLPAGALCCLVGAHDTGKTAWLRTLAAVEPPVAGTLSIAGQDARPDSRDAWRRLRARAAYISAEAPLLSVLSGLSNVMLPAQYHNLGDPDAIRAKALAWLDRIGWQGPLERLPAYLSRHQRCLLAIARCLMLDPAVLCINEPFHMTDVDGWPHLARVFVSLARDHGIAHVVLTHDLAFARRHADVILFTSIAGIVAYPDWSSFAAANDPDAMDFRSVAEAALAGA